MQLTSEQQQQGRDANINKPAPGSLQHTFAGQQPANASKPIGNGTGSGTYSPAVLSPVAGLRVRPGNLQLHSSPIASPVGSPTRFLTTAMLGLELVRPLSPAFPRTVANPSPYLDVAGTFHMLATSPVQHPQSAPYGAGQLRPNTTPNSSGSAQQQWGSVSLPSRGNKWGSGGDRIHSSNLISNSNTDITLTQQRQQLQSPVGRLPSSSSCRTATANCTGRRRHDWDGNTNVPVEPTLEGTLQAWKADVDIGMYGPRFLGSLAAVSTGLFCTSPAATSHSNKRPIAAAGRVPDGGDVSAGAVPALFEGTGSEGIQALEAAVLKGLVAKPNLTLMQLQRSIEAISQLESPFQLAATGVLLKGGFWTAAMQIAYADLTVLGEVLLEMQSIIETGLNWHNQELAAATWYWAAQDRDLFMRSFRGLGLISQYQQLRRQSRRLQLVNKQHQLTQQQIYAGAAPSSRVVATPELATAERWLLLSVIHNYLDNVDAAVRAQGSADAGNSAGISAAGAEAMQGSQRTCTVEIANYLGQTEENRASTSTKGEVDSPAVDGAGGQAASSSIATPAPLQVSSNREIKVPDVQQDKASGSSADMTLEPASGDQELLVRWPHAAGSASGQLQKIGSTDAQTVNSRIMSAASTQRSGPAAKARAASAAAATKATPVGSPPARMRTKAPGEYSLAKQQVPAGRTPAPISAKQQPPQQQMQQRALATAADMLPGEALSADALTLSNPAGKSQRRSSSSSTAAKGQPPAKGARALQGQ
eukprot:GHRR01020559.1.p1 GENE.GHRR01020559.1~~GHRR01020559.1.p1  ORF type:complete len:761 (+),score=310.92 GHRR01020559.1:214-2496(+)